MWLSISFIAVLFPQLALYNQNNKLSASMSTDWKSKLSSYGEAILDIIFEGVLIAVWILVTFGLSLLARVTFGTQFSEIEERITNIALLLIGIVGSLELIVSITIRTYIRLRKELQNVR
jgi:hypothetical protein